VRDSPGFWRVAFAALPLVGLTACPQLLRDDFRVDVGDSSPPSADASGKPPGPRGSRDDGPRTPPPPELDAGNAGDAGGADAAPLSPVQVALRATLAHRYRFDSAAPLLDSVGGANADSVGATFSAGAAVLAGDGQYIDLPNGLLSGLRNASFEIWVTWDVADPTDSTSAWQRIFDLGRNLTSVEGQQCEVDADATSLYLTPRTNAGSLQLKCETCGETQIQTAGLAVGVLVQLVAVVDDDANLFSLYRNGELVASPAFPGSLATITTCSGRPAPCDWNNWIGRSQHIEDPSFEGKILDFRIYSAALDGSLIRDSFSAGPDLD